MAAITQRSLRSSKMILVICIVATTILSIKLNLTEAHSPLTDLNSKNTHINQQIDHPDAPKFYHLNALLYKESRESVAAAVGSNPKPSASPQEVALGLPLRSGKSFELNW